jgi:hypothetical protein
MVGRATARDPRGRSPAGSIRGVVSVRYRQLLEGAAELVVLVVLLAAILAAVVVGDAVLNGRPS